MYVSTSDFPGMHTKSIHSSSVSYIKGERESVLKTEQDGQVTAFV